jgi:hypothetical protein
MTRVPILILADSSAQPQRRHAGRLGSQQTIRSARLTPSWQPSRECLAACFLRADPAPTSKWHNHHAPCCLARHTCSPFLSIFTHSSSPAKEWEPCCRIAMADHAQARVGFPRHLPLPKLWFRHHQTPPFPGVGQLLFADPVPGYVVVEPTHCHRHAD